MKRLTVLILALCLLLCACRTEKPVVTDPSTRPESTSTPTTAPTSPATEPETAPTTVLTEPTEPPVLYRHPITGEPLDAPFTGRCVSVVINNNSHAQPLYGIGDADILYECMAEGGGSITRCLAVFSDIARAEKIGSIRSVRTYFVDLARIYNAVLFHCGGSPFGHDEIRQIGYDAVDQMYNGGYFYRDQARLDAGYAREHTLFSSGESLLACIEKKGFSMEHEYDPAFLPEFSGDAVPDGEAADTIELRFNAGGKATVMRYDGETGCYYGEQRWRSGGEYSIVEPLADASWGEAVPYRNVLVLYVKITHSSYSSHVFAQQTGSGEGYYACGGQIVPILWHRESLDEPFTYTLLDGTPLVQGIGKTYAALLPEGSPVTYS